MILRDDCFCMMKWWVVTRVVVNEKVGVDIDNIQMAGKIRPLDVQVSKRESLDFEC